MALSAVSSALQTIGNAVAQEAIYLWGVQEQVDCLQSELKWMQIFLRKVDAKPALANDEIIRLWTAEIRELAYDAEDVIEDFALRIGFRSSGGLSNCIETSACILKEGRMLHQTRSKIEKIFTRVTDLVRRLQAYGIKELREEDETSTSAARRELRLEYPHIMEYNIVGLDTDVEKLVSVIVDEESESRLVSICGMGGLGKTTLAKKIYHHSQVKNQFDHLVWVNVSQQFQKRKVWTDIVSSLDTSFKNDRNLRNEDIAKQLFDFLKKSQCLLILDDIWTKEAWDIIKPAFPEKETRTKILLTSRNTEIVSHADSRGYLHQLQFLNPDQSWDLFQKIAFSQVSAGSKVEGEMKELGKNMVEHCGGLPLAIVVLGGILATKDSVNEWKMVSDNVESYLKRGKGHGLRVEEVLALSYDDLPHYLRPCFLYLANFPEDFKIQVDRLIQLWVAEGIVLSEEEDGTEGSMIEDLAERYLTELVERCMLQVRERDVRIKTVQMHDLMRSLCLSKAKQENFLHYIDESNASSISTVRRIHRVSAPHVLWIKRIKSPNLRSFLFFGGIWNEVLEEMKVFRKPFLQKMLNYLKNHEEEFVDRSLFFSIAVYLVFFGLIPEFQGLYTYMFNNFKLLRVFSYEGNDPGEGGWSRWKLSSDIGNLIHLRFLSLRGLPLVLPILPSSLGNLRRLQSLDLRVEGFFTDSVHVPNVIRRMEQLRHLYLPRKCKRRTKLKLDTLRNLQTLVNFNTDNCYLKDLINMTNIRELVIRGPFQIKDFNAEDSDKNPPIIQSKYLHSLSIINDEGRIDPRHLNHLLSSCLSVCKLSLAVEIGELPEYVSSCSNLTYLNLKRSTLKEDPMPKLEKLPSLRVLELRSLAFEGKEMFCSAQGFPNLESLSLAWLYILEEWTVDDGAMPCLEKLEIEGCARLKRVPDGLRYIKTLRKLEIKFMPQRFIDKLVEGGEDFGKVRDVPSRIFKHIIW